MVMKPAPSPPHTYHNGHLGQRFRGSARANDLDDRCASRWPNSCKSTRKPPKMSSDVRATHSTLRERPVAHARKISPRADSARLARSVSRRRSNEARRDNEAARWSARAAPSGRERLPRAHTARQQHRSAGSRVARRPRGCSWLMMRPGTAGRLQKARSAVRRADHRRCWIDDGLQWSADCRPLQIGRLRRPTTSSSRRNSTSRTALAAGGLAAGARTAAAALAPRAASSSTPPTLAVPCAVRACVVYVCVLTGICRAQDLRCVADGTQREDPV